ncbi:hypothetical protein D3C87_1683400 [compost metagenome]
MFMLAPLSASASISLANNFSASILAALDAEDFTFNAFPSIVIEPALSVSKEISSDSMLTFIVAALEASNLILVD